MKRNYKIMLSVFLELSRQWSHRWYSNHDKK